MLEQDRYWELLTQGLSGGAMRAIGIEDVELREALPRALDASVFRVDTVWRMVDGRILHLGFRTAHEASLDRSLQYDIRLARRFKAPVRTVVLYDARVALAADTLDRGAIQYRVENVFLRHFRGESVLDVVAQHLAAQTWEPADRLRLALALGMATDDRRALFGQMLGLLKQIPKAGERDFVMAAILALPRRLLSREETAMLVKELSAMSKILDEAKRQGREEVARAMLAEGDSVEKVVRVTGLIRSAVESLRTS